MLIGLVVKAEGAPELFEGAISDEVIQGVVGTTRFKRMTLGQGYVAFVSDNDDIDDGSDNINASFVLNILGYVPNENSSRFFKNNVLFIGGDEEEDISLTEPQLKVIRVLAHS